MDSAEVELKRIEDEMKALKASYPIVASKVKFYLTRSEIFTVSGGGIVRFKNTPNYGRGKTMLNTLSAVIKDYPASPENIEVVPVQYNEAQDGTGDVVINVNLSSFYGSGWKLQITAQGVSTGTFSQL